MTTTEFLRIQQQAGGVVDDELRSRMIAGVGPSSPGVLHFGDVSAEVAAARESAVVFDLSDRVQIEIGGADRATFMHNFCTNDIKKLQPGEGCEAFITNVKGRVLGHVFLFAGPSSLWLDTIPGQEEALLAHLDRYVITEDVTFASQSNDLRCLFVSGPQAASLLEAADISSDNLEPGEHRTRDDALIVRRVDWLSQHGFELAVPNSQLSDIWQRLVDGGVQPAGSVAFHTLRIQAGFPWYGSDVTDDNLPQETGRTEQAISFTKGCYLGQEPIARLDAMGHVNKELSVLQVDSASPPSAGSVIRPANDQKEIGKVTSSARAANLTVALAYLRTAYVEPDTELTIDVAGESITAKVVPKQ